MINQNLKTLEVPIDSLSFDPNNARTHSKKNLAAIKASLERFGQQKPIVTLKDGTVIAGNGTLAAAKELGWTSLAAVKFDNEKKARAFALADNRTAELAQWDGAALLDALDDIGEDVSFVGFTKEEMKKLREKISDDFDDTEQTMEKVFQVVIDCADEEQQEEALNKVLALGFKRVKAMTL